MLPKPKITKWGVKAGTKIELEHTRSRVKAKKIAMDHLHEFGDAYYHGLIKLESRLKKQLKRR
jgi:hypothetical protein